LVSGVPVRCYFHIVGGSDDFLDESGVEVDSLEEARAEALMVIDELRRHDRSIVEHWGGRSMRIVDEVGRLLSVIPLGPADCVLLKVNVVDDVPDLDAGPSRADTH
jgi:hypothetical protein